MDLRIVMADEKQVQDLALKQSPIHRLPAELYLKVFSYFSLKFLGRLGTVSKFFLQLTREAMLFGETAKDLLFSVFYTEKEEEPLTKKFLRDQIHNAPKKVDFSGIKFRQVDYVSFPEKNITLSNTFYHIFLLNRVAISIFRDRDNGNFAPIIFPSPLVGRRAEFNCKVYHENDIKINAKEYNFLQHCILYYFDALPAEPEAKSALRCFYDCFHFGHVGNVLVLSIGSVDSSALVKVKNELQRWHKYRFEV